MEWYSPRLVVAFLLFLLFRFANGQEECLWRYRRNPTDCNSFFQCDFGRSILQYCPPGLEWNSRIRACDWPFLSHCRPEFEHNDVDDRSDFHFNEKDSCNNGFQPDPSDCGKYFICAHGSLVPMSCTAPLHWNPTANVCDWPQNAGCSTSGAKPPPAIVGPPAPPPEEVGPDPDEDTDPTTTSERPSSTTPTPPVTTTDGSFPPDPTIVGIIMGPTTDRPTTTKPPTTKPTTKKPPTTKPTTKKPPTTKPTTVGPPAPPPSSSDDIIVPPPPPPPPPQMTPDGYKVICYFTGWSWYRPGEGKFGPDDVQADLCTHYVYAFALLDWNWKIKPADSWIDIDNRFYARMTELRKRGRKVTIGLGGWNDSAGQRYSLLLRDPEKLTVLVQSIVAFVKEHEFDGVDLDYEYPGCPQGECKDDYSSDRNGFTTLVKLLREQLPPGSIISAAVSCNKNIIDKGYDVKTLSQYVDWFGVMVYDIHGSWEKETGHIAPLYHHPLDKLDYLNANYSINYWMSKGAPASKLVMGVPLYGQSFTLKNRTDSGLFAPSLGGGNAGTYSRQRGILAYYEICSSDWKHQIEDDEGRMGPYLVQDDQWVSYDNAQFIRKKMDYVRNNHLAGAMVWSLDFDDFNNKCGQGRYPLITTIRNSLRGPM